MTTDQATAAKNDSPFEALVEGTLFRLTQGLPMTELRLIVSEAEACEAELLKDIELLEKALSEEGAGDKSEDVDAILNSALTPMDQYWTASSLIGRLRDNLLVPPIPNAPILPPNPLIPVNSRHQPVGASEFLSLIDNPVYTKKHENNTQLMALYKKLSAHRSAIVFKKPVRDEEAPGYSDRIKFKMDLSLIRKLIVAGSITSYKDFHEYASLISHNCVKFNGRESDYGILARDFEQASDEAIRQAVLSGPATRRTPTPMPDPLPAESAAAPSEPTATAEKVD